MRAGGFLLLCLLFRVSAAASDPGELVFGVESGVAAIQVRGSRDEDWRIESSSDFTRWVTLTNLGTLLSGGVEAPFRSLGNANGGALFYRAVKTAGLYDQALLRTISLTFTQANWSTLLANARTSGNNVIGNLSLDNGATNASIGARYKGNTSYTMSGQKKSINISIDAVDPSAELMGYESIILNNAYADETIMREPLYFTLMNQYTVCPRGSLARLNVNGVYWGVYSLAQNEDGDLIHSHPTAGQKNGWIDSSLTATRRV